MKWFTANEIAPRGNSRNCNGLGLLDEENFFLVPGEDGLRLLGFLSIANNQKVIYLSFDFRA